MDISEYTHKLQQNEPQRQERIRSGLHCYESRRIITDWPHKLHQALEHAAQHHAVLEHYDSDPVYYEIALIMLDHARELGFEAHLKRTRSNKYRVRIILPTITEGAIGDPIP